TGLVDRRLAAAKALDLELVYVHAPDLAAQLGEAGSRHQPDVAGTDHRDWLARAHEAGKASCRAPTVTPLGAWRGARSPGVYENPENRMLRCRIEQLLL